MMRIAVVAFFVLATLAACADPTTSQTLPVETITIDTHHGPRVFTVEIAADMKSQERGLMFRRQMDPDAGMLFVFNPPQLVSFWMKNTFIPLDLMFVRSDGTISTIAANAAPLSETSIPSAEPVRAVIEINGGRAQALGIAPGDRVHASQFTVTAQ
jgi:uncharacterized membrane protein (UPF0127 family)